MVCKRKQQNAEDIDDLPRNLSLDNVTVTSSQNSKTFMFGTSVVSAPQPASLSTDHKELGV